MIGRIPLENGRPKRRESIMFDNSEPGRRVRLVYTSDPYTSLKPGDEGTAEFRDSAGVLHIHWDTGNRLGLIPGIDRWEWLEEKE